jgi:phosphoglycolate phosphatase-like HAD superfamily hydrolase
MSRYEKFDHFFHDILQSPKRPEDLQGVLTSYAAFIREGLNRCAEVRGARTFLECLRQADARCFVVSGSDQEELREVLAARNLAGYFQGIFGSPEKKMDIVRRVWAEERQRGAVSASLCGDSRLDFEVARSCGLRFIMIHGYTEWDGWREMLPPDVTSCTDFVELPKANLCG